LDNGVSVEVIDVGDEVVIAVAGEGDMVSAPTLKAALEACDVRADVVLDVEGVTFMDSTGLNLVVAHARRAHPAGGSIRLRAPCPQIQRLLKITGLESFVEPADDRAPASRSSDH